MLQQIFAVILILFFILRLFSAKSKGAMSSAEFNLWLVFWLFSIAVVISIKKIDALVAFIGFSSSGINVMLYFAIISLFYLLFRIRLKIEKMDKDITKLVREISLNKTDKT